MVSTEFSAYLERLKHHGIPTIPRLALDLHAKVKASPRLLAHHFLVHQAAATLLSELNKIVPGLRINGEAVLFGAATHDIGKAVVTRELSEPGREHEILGFVLLMENSVPASLARFAKDHGLGSELDHIDDLLVCLADKVWKGKRDQTLEETFIKAVCDSEHLDFWDIYPHITSLLDAVATEADLRLAIQAEFPCPPMAEAESSVNLLVHRPGRHHKNGRTMTQIVFSLETGYYNSTAPEDLGKDVTLWTPQLIVFPSAQAAAQGFEGINILEGDLSFFSHDGTPLEANFSREPYIDNEKNTYFPGTYTLQPGTGDSLQTALVAIISANDSPHGRIIVRVPESDSSALQWGWPDAQEMTKNTIEALRILPPELTEKVAFEEM